ncbi:Amino acid transporter AVT1D [Holothuria leucospilota]|uniref:Amino acid transporter AVT1D n=1 Tax=Holothuria leucospilota TaxID=206669 RepID=A0A9Q1BTL5_HOLLE|nr:Amino acid transporter AVT1D [Holothuria leucospilota]
MPADGETSKAGSSGDQLLDEGKPDLPLLSHDKEEESSEGENSLEGHYGIFTAAVFIIATVAGSGVVLLPSALAKTGWTGMIALILTIILEIYTGALLGRCWIILQERFPATYKQQNRYPYPAIAYEAFGTVGRVIVSLTIQITLLLIIVAYLIIVAENGAVLLGLEDVNTCYTLTAVAIIIFPFTWFGTPKDFYLVAIGGAATTGFASILLLISMLTQTSYNADVKLNPTAPSFTRFFAGTGVMIVSFSGHVSFPTIQHDMADPSKFPQSLVLGGFVVSLYFIPMTVVGYALYGDLLLQYENIFQVVGDSFEKTMSLLLITAHVMVTVLIYGNPLFQEVEHIFGIETSFTWKRVATRFSILLFSWFISITVPASAVVLSLLGGTALLALSLICPVGFYWKLRMMESPTKSGERKPLSTTEVIIFACILVLSAFLSISTTYSDLSHLGSDLFFNVSLPCYLKSMELP